jgi:hypothetical protein
LQLDFGFTLKAPNIRETPDREVAGFMKSSVKAKPETPIFH